MNARPKSAVHWEAEPTSRRRRILFVTKASGRGGAEKHLVDLILRLDQSRVEPVILCYGVDAYSQNFNRPEGLALEVVKEPLPNSFFSFWRSLRKHRPEIVVFINGHPGMFPWFACAAGRLSGAEKVVALVHKDPSGQRVSRGALALLIRLKKYVARGRFPGLICHQTICVSQTMRERLVREIKYPAQKTFAVPNGVDLDYYKRNGITRHPAGELKTSSEDLLLVCVARLVPPKQIDLLITALAEIRRQYPTCKLVLVGDGPLEAELREKAAALGVARVVIFAGHAADVRPYLESGDIFVLPSRWEGMPLVLLEAMAYGLPCVATNVGGNKEVIVDGKTGIVVEPGSTSALAEAVLYLATHKEERMKMGLNGRKRVEQFFDIEKTMSKLNALLMDGGKLESDQPPSFG